MAAVVEEGGEESVHQRAHFARFRVFIDGNFVLFEEFCFTPAIAPTLRRIMDYITHRLRVDKKCPVEVLAIGIESGRIVRERVELISKMAERLYIIQLKPVGLPSIDVTEGDGSTPSVTDSTGSSMIYQEPAAPILTDAFGPLPENVDDIHCIHLRIFPYGSIGIYEDRRVAYDKNTPPSVGVILQGYGENFVKHYGSVNAVLTRLDEETGVEKLVEAYEGIENGKSYTLALLAIATPLEDELKENEADNKN